MAVVRERESPVLTEEPEEEPEEAPKEEKITHPLDEEILNLENGFIPGWDRVVNKLNLHDLPRGEKKLFRSFYRAHRMYARGKNTKGKELIRRLERRRHFKEFEKKFSNQLDDVVTIVSKGARRRS